MNLSKRSIGSVAKYGFLCLGSLTTIFPFLWVGLSSLKTTNEIIGSPFSLPASPSFTNFAKVWVLGNIGKGFLNSMICTVATVILVVILSSMVSYILARVWKSELVYLYFIMGIMIPAHAIIIPLFIMIRTIGLTNSLAGIVCAYVGGGLPFSVFVLVGFMRGIPHELEESAVLDGCNNPQIFANIIVPLAKSGVATIATLQFLNTWNDFLFASVLLSTKKVQTITSAIFNLKGVYQTDYAAICAGLVVAVVPVMIMYVIFQKQVIEGMAAGAVKG
jgi:ABC-type glycerol-3-phosphate transport system permease component